MLIRTVCKILPMFSALALPLIAMAGDLDNTLSPSLGSGMPSTGDIFNQLATGTPANIPGTFQEPVSAPGSTGRTLSDIKSMLPAADNLNGAAVTDVVQNKTFWGLRTDGTWGLKTGTLVPTGNATGTATVAEVLSGSTFSNASGSGLVGTMPNHGFAYFDPGIVDIPIPAGYYTGGQINTHVNLRSGNIVKGVSIFGVNGLAIEAKGNALPQYVLSPYTFSITGEAEMAGTMSNRGLANFTAGATDIAVNPGYYSGGWINTDANLKTYNIRSGVTIFGVSGDPNVVNTGSTTATAGDIVNLKTAWVNGSQVTGTMPVGYNNYGLNGSLGINIGTGYYNGTQYAYASDTNLVSGNIKKGSSIFGVNGSTNVVDTTSGDAVASDIASTKIAWVDGSQVTGTVPAGASVSGVDGEISVVIPYGLYRGLSTVKATAVDSNLIPANIKKTTTIFGVVGTLIQATGTATADKVLQGNTFSNDTAAGVAGTMLDRGTLNITPTAASQPITAGYYSGTGSVAGDADLVAGNIKSGVAIFGVNGSVIPATGTASAANVLSGATYSIATAANQTGTMPNRGAVTITPGTAAQAITAGYHNGSGTVAGDVNLYTGNILSGKTIFGVAGKTEVVDTYTTSPAVAANITKSKVAFVNGATVTGTLYGGYTCSGSLSNSRFCDNGDGTIRDMNTGLLWLKNANCAATLGGVVKTASGAATDKLSWDDAGAWISNLVNTYCGLSSNSINGGYWRLPTWEEMQYFISTVRISTPYNFTGIQSGLYWTSNTPTAFGAWAFNATNGTNANYAKSTLFYVWPVRSAAP